MKDITPIIEENCKEAIEIVKKNGGRIDFVEGIVDDNWDDNPNMYNVPWVVVGYDEGIIDTAVLAVRNNGVCLEFLAFDNVACECYGWIYSAECCSNSENEVYMFLEKYNK